MGLTIIEKLNFLGAMLVIFMMAGCASLDHPEDSASCKELSQEFQALNLNIRSFQDMSISTVALSESVTGQPTHYLFSR